MENLHNIHFINNSNNSSKKKEKEMDIDFFDNKYSIFMLKNPIIITNQIKKMMNVI